MSAFTKKQSTTNLYRSVSDRKEKASCKTVTRLHVSRMLATNIIAMIIVFTKGGADYKDILTIDGLTDDIAAKVLIKEVFKTEQIIGVVGKAFHLVVRALMLYLIPIGITLVAFVDYFKYEKQSTIELTALALVILPMLASTSITYTRFEFFVRKNYQDVHGKVKYLDPSKIGELLNKHYDQIAEMEANRKK